MKRIEFRRECPYVIICEGKDEEKFLIRYLEFLKQNDETFQDCHYIVDLGGNNDITEALKTIKSIKNYQKMKSFLIVRDAETDVTAAISSVRNNVKKVWNVELGSDGGIKQDENGVKIGFFLFPGTDDNGRFCNGTLEDLCVNILTDFDESISAEKLLEQTDEHLRKIVEIRGGEMKWQHKNRIHMYFSSTDKFVGSKIGEAADKGAFDFSNVRLSRLREMILATQE